MKKTIYNEICTSKKKRDEWNVYLEILFDEEEEEYQIKFRGNSGKVKWTSKPFRKYVFSLIDGEELLRQDNELYECIYEIDKTIFRELAKYEKEKEKETETSESEKIETEDKTKKKLTPLEVKEKIIGFLDEYHEKTDEILILPKVRELAKCSDCTPTELVSIFKGLLKDKTKNKKGNGKISIDFEEHENRPIRQAIKAAQVNRAIKVAPNLESIPGIIVSRKLNSPEREEAIRYLTERAGLTEASKEDEDEIEEIKELGEEFFYQERTPEEIKAEEAELRAEIKEILKETDGGGAEIISELLTRYITDNYKIFTIIDDKVEEMWFYEDGIYKPNGMKRVQKILRRILRENLTPDRKNKVLIKIESDSFIDPVDFFNVNYLTEIPVQNGILNIETRELKPFTPMKIFFNKLPMDYNPEAKCPNVEAHFNATLKGPDDVKVMFELFGYCLWKDNFLEKAVMFTAFGRNGKSKTLELLKTFIGPLNTVSVPLQNLSDNSFEVSELFGKMINLAGDISTEEIKHTGTIKMLTGRDTLTAKRKFLTGITFMNFSKLIFACNELPKVYDTSRGFWSRWIIFEFPYTFIKKDEMDALKDEEKVNKKLMDPDIVKKLTTPEELSGLLNAALDGLDNIRKQKGFSYSKGVDEIMNFWIRNSDSFLAFSTNHLESDYAGKISKLDLRKAYSEYCKKYQAKTVSDKAIKRHLQDSYGVDEEYTSAYGAISGGGTPQVWSWVGIKWKGGTRPTF